MFERIKDIQELEKHWQSFFGIATWNAEQPVTQAKDPYLTIADIIERMSGDTNDSKKIGVPNCQSQTN